MTTIVEVPVRDSKGKRATRRGQFLANTTATDDEDDPNGEVLQLLENNARGYWPLAVLGPAEGLCDLLVSEQVRPCPLLGPVPTSESAGFGTGDERRRFPGAFRDSRRETRTLSRSRAAGDLAGRRGNQCPLRFLG
jgi:hypothetical protein